MASDAARTQAPGLVGLVLRRVGRILRATEDGGLVVILGAICVIVFLGVVARFVFNQPLQWADEIALALFVWLMMVGAAAGWRSHDIFGIDVLVDRLPLRQRTRVWWFNYSVVALVCLLGIWWGVELALNGFTEFTLNLHLPRFFISLAFPVGMALMLWHTGEHMARLRRGEIPIDDRLAEASDVSLSASGPTL